MEKNKREVQSYREGEGERLKEEAKDRCSWENPCGSPVFFWAPKGSEKKRREREKWVGQST